MGTHRNIRKTSRFLFLPILLLVIAVINRRSSANLTFFFYYLNLIMGKSHVRHVAKEPERLCCGGKCTLPSTRREFYYINNSKVRLNNNTLLKNMSSLT